MKASVPIAVTGFLFACASAPPNQALSWNGYGAVAFGMTVSRVEELIGQGGSRATGEASCDYVSFDQYPGIDFMIEKGVITRADAETHVPNELGITVGTTLEEVKRQYPSVLVQPAKYSPNGHDLWIHDKTGKKAVLLEEEKGKVVSVRAGLLPSVGYVERCL